MENNKKPMIVPWDFTHEAQYALDHAVRIAKILDNDITLVHIIDEGGMLSNKSGIKKKIEEATDRLNEISENTYREHGTKPMFIVKQGNIYNTINEISNELEARMVVMGTHGYRGIEKFTGSKALKVIAGSKIPFMVVQSPYEYRPYNDIVFPVDHKPENKEKLVWANYMSHYFGSKIMIIIPNHSDDFLRRNTLANLNFAKKYLEEKNISYEIHYANKKKKFSEQMVEFAQQVNTNLILIMITKEIGWQNYLFGADEQTIIANKAKISVMCVNPRTDLRRGGFNQ
ncbi:MAG: universal stress protein [Bacteroidia bacterium]|nr:universal stress protein [Bacteroidia bacterium]